jgi:hypothetical protein
MQKSVQIFNCDSCDYNTSSTRDFNKHLLTAKHKNATNNATLAIIGNEKVAREKIQYNCKCCNYETNRKWSYDKHLLSEKHKKNISGEPTEVIYNCSRCNKEYLSYNAFWKHKKQCVIIEEREPEKTILTPDMFMLAIKESTELRNVLVEQNKELQKKLLELASKQTNTNNINSHNTNNNHFNLQFFLNEKCKDAMNIVDFVNSLKITIEDFETTGKIGFVDGISRIFIKELKKLETEKLPIHCTDLKRETVYIKDNNIWEKENDEKKRLKWTIDSVAKMNFNQLQQWQTKYPECFENNTAENNKYIKFAMAALGGEGKDEEEKFRDRIMKNVLKEVLLDKKRIVL